MHVVMKNPGMVWIDILGRFKTAVTAAGGALLEFLDITGRHLVKGIKSISDVIGNRLSQSKIVSISLEKKVHELPVTVEKLADEAHCQIGFPYQPSIDVRQAAHRGSDGEVAQEVAFACVAEEVAIDVKLAAQAREVLAGEQQSLIQGQEQFEPRLVARWRRERA